MPVQVDVNDKYSCPLLDFLESLPADCARSGDGILQLLEHISRNGPRNLPDSLSHYVDKKEHIWQFTKGKLRVLWFYDEGQLIVCSHGFIKKTQATPASEKGKAIDLKAQYFAAKNAEQLEFIELD